MPLAEEPKWAQNSCAALYNSYRVNARCGNQNPKEKKAMHRRNLKSVIFWGSVALQMLVPILFVVQTANANPACGDLLYTWTGATTAGGPVYHVKAVVTPQNRPIFCGDGSGSPNSGISTWALPMTGEKK